MTVKKPNLSVIDYAIGEIKNEFELFTCYALRRAVYRHQYPTSENDWLYRAQYEKYVRSRNKGRLPSWWNDGIRHKQARLNALRGFKQACIDAGMKAKQ